MSKDSDVIAPWRAFLRAHAIVIDVMADEMQAQTGLPLCWYEVLLYLSESPQGRLRMHELADSMLLSRSAATRFVDRMEAAGLVERIVCAEDRRGLELAMTAQGHDIFRRAGRVHLRGIKEHFAAHLSPEEADALRLAMDRVAAAAQVARGDHHAA